MKCDCGAEMYGLGNVSNMVYTSNPVQWDEVYVCHPCKKRKTVRISAVAQPVQPNIQGYQEVSNCISPAVTSWQQSASVVAVKDQRT